MAANVRTHPPSVTCGMRLSIKDGMGPYEEFWPLLFFIINELQIYGILHPPPVSEGVTIISSHPKDRITFSSPFGFKQMTAQ